MKATFRLYLILQFLSSLSLSVAGTTYVIFLRSRGLNYFESNFVNVICFLTVFLFEIPTGIVADLFGRKWSFVASCLILALSGLVYGNSYTLSGFLVAEILAAIGLTCSSGAFEAWVVDRLKEQGYSNQRVISSRGNFTDRVAATMGGILGGFIGDINLAYPWFATSAVSLVTAVIACLYMKESPRRQEEKKNVNHLKEMIMVGKNAVREVQGNTEFRLIILLDSVFIFAVQGVNMQWQPFFAQWVENTTLGFVKAGINLSILFGGWLVMRVGAKRKNKELIFLSFLGLGFPLFLTVLTHNFLWSLGGFLLHEVARGLYNPLKSAYLNDQIESNDRATLLSIVSMCRGLVGAGGLLVSGLVAEYLSIRTSWFLSGLCFVSFTFFYARKVKN